MNKSKVRRWNRFTSEHGGRRTYTDLFLFTHWHRGGRAFSDWLMADGFVRSSYECVTWKPWGVAIHPERWGVSCP